MVNSPAGRERMKFRAGAKGAKRRAHQKQIRSDRQTVGGVSEGGMAEGDQLFFSRSDRGIIHRSFEVDMFVRVKIDVVHTGRANRPWRPRDHSRCLDVMSSIHGVFLS